jgi:sporulation-control protein spo0M
MNCVLSFSLFTAFTFPLKLLISLIFLFGGMSAYKIGTIMLTKCCQYNSRVQIEADSDSTCVLVAVNLCKGHKSAPWRTFQRNFMVVYCWNLDCE